MTYLNYAATQARNAEMLRAAEVRRAARAPSVRRRRVSTNRMDSVGRRIALRVAATRGGRWPAG